MANLGYVEFPSPGPTGFPKEVTPGQGVPPGWRVFQFKYKTGVQEGRAVVKYYSSDGRHKGLSLKRAVCVDAKDRGEDAEKSLQRHDEITLKRRTSHREDCICYFEQHYGRLKPAELLRLPGWKVHPEDGRKKDKRYISPEGNVFFGCPAVAAHLGARMAEGQDFASLFAHVGKRPKVPNEQDKRNFLRIRRRILQGKGLALTKGERIALARRWRRFLYGPMVRKRRPQAVGGMVARRAASSAEPAAAEAMGGQSGGGAESVQRALVQRGGSADALAEPKQRSRRLEPKVIGLRQQQVEAFRRVCGQLTEEAVLSWPGWKAKANTGMAVATSTVFSSPAGEAPEGQDWQTLVALECHFGRKLLGGASLPAYIRRLSGSEAIQETLGAKIEEFAPESGIVPGSEDEAWVRNHPIWLKITQRGYPLPISEREILALRSYTPRAFGGLADVTFL